MALLCMCSFPFGMDRFPPLCTRDGGTRTCRFDQGAKTDADALVATAREYVIDPLIAEMKRAKKGRRKRTP